MILVINKGRLVRLLFYPDILSKEAGFASTNELVAIEGSL